MAGPEVVDVEEERGRIEDVEKKVIMIDFNEAELHNNRHQTLLRQTADYNIGLLKLRNYSGICNRRDVERNESYFKELLDRDLGSDSEKEERCAEKSSIPIPRYFDIQTRQFHYPDYLVNDE
ncbi:MAG: hypothetical protein MHMPM18_002965 [Marteilia pararefringens]